MLNWLTTRASQGHRTLAYPAEPVTMPETYLGRPAVEAIGKSCPPDCRECIASCPTDAITIQPVVSLDLGRCVFCSDCVQACPEQIFRLSNDFRTASTSREGLRIRDAEVPAVEKLQESMLRIFGRSMRIRHVSAGDCGGCKDEFNAMSNIVFDLSRFGIGVVASPRHADALVISGPIPENMRVALEKCWLAMPQPRLVIALGACAISGGPFLASPFCHQGVESILPVDLYIPGCPPHPLTVLDGLLRLLDRLPDAPPPKSPEPGTPDRTGDKVIA